MIFQNPKSSLNPFVTVGPADQRGHSPAHGVTNASEARERRSAGWNGAHGSPRLRFDQYPDGLSGGMCQRAMIAMALASRPSLLIADEPTTGLNATIQSRIVALLAELQSEVGVTTLLITHDIRVVSRWPIPFAVMYGGTVMEHGPARDVLATGLEPKPPLHRALLASLPSAQNNGRRHASMAGFR